MRLWRKRNHGHYLAWTRKNNQRPINKKKRQAASGLRNIERYGISVQDFRRMLSGQRGRCAICSAKSPPKRKTRWLHIDHNHASGRVRGLLCSRCNGALGWFEKHQAAVVKYVGAGGAQ
jgi:hypothetical protein